MNRESEIIGELNLIIAIANSGYNTLLINKLTKLKDNIEDYFLMSYDAESEIRKILSNE